MAITLHLNALHKVNLVLPRLPFQSPQYPFHPSPLSINHRASNCTILAIRQPSTHLQSLTPTSAIKNSPLRPLLVKHPMSTLLAPYRITQVQGHLARALAAHISHGGRHG
jgi:hypothetical protein